MFTIIAYLPGKISKLTFVIKFIWKCWRPHLGFMATWCGFLKFFSQFKGDFIIFKDAFGFYSDQIFLCHDGHSGLCQTASLKHFILSRKNSVFVPYKCHTVHFPTTFFRLRLLLPSQAHRWKLLLTWKETFPNSYFLSLPLCIVKQ